MKYVGFQPFGDLCLIVKTPAGRFVKLLKITRRKQPFYMIRSLNHRWLQVMGSMTHGEKANVLANFLDRSGRLVRCSPAPGRIAAAAPGSAALMQLIEIR